MENIQKPTQKLVQSFGSSSHDANRIA